MGRVAELCRFCAGAELSARKKVPHSDFCRGGGAGIGVGHLDYPSSSEETKR